MDRLNAENVLGYKIDGFKNFMVRSSLCIKWNLLASSYDFMCVNILIKITFKKYYGFLILNVYETNTLLFIFKQFFDLRILSDFRPLWSTL